MFIHEKSPNKCSTMKLTEPSRISPARDEVSNARAAVTTTVAATNVSAITEQRCIIKNPVRKNVSKLAEILRGLQAEYRKHSYFADESDHMVLTVSREMTPIDKY